MGFVDVKVREATVPLRGKAVRVYSPVVLPDRISCSAYGEGDWHIIADREGLHKLARWAMLAAAKTGSIVYIPKGLLRPHWVKPPFETIDLVFCHHSLQLPVSAWKKMRQYLAGGHPRTFSVRAPEPSHEYHRPGDDLFDFARHSQTMFISASEQAFQDLASLFACLAESTESGDHGHLYYLVRGNAVRDHREDLTAMYAAPNDWV